ncbi:MAG: ATP-binding protein [Bacteroidota bacterium]
MDPSEIEFYRLLVSGMLGMLLLAIGIVTFVVVYQRQLIHKQEEIAQLEISFQKELLQGAIITQEEERKRIAQDLHDSIGSLLSGAALYLNQVNSTPNSPASNAQQQSSSLIKEAMGSIRTITRDLLPVNLQRFGLVDALQDLLSKTTGGANLEVHYIHQGYYPFEEQKELAIYRITQELLNNTLKYAEAQNIYLQLHFADGQLDYSYRDDGKGFEYDQYQRSAKEGLGLGLGSIESRFRIMEGEASFNSSPGKGVLVRIQGPVQSQKTD